MNWIVDVCLSVEIPVVLSSEGWNVKHWSEIGPWNALDREIMSWCVENDHGLITADTVSARSYGLVKDHGQA